MVQALVGVTKDMFEGSRFARMAFRNTVANSLGRLRGAAPNVTITGYIPTFTRRRLDDSRSVPLSSSSPRVIPSGTLSDMTAEDISLHDVAATGVQVLYNVVLVFSSTIASNSSASLMSSVNSSLSAAVSSSGGGASSFSTMLTTQFLNITDAEGSIDSNIFAGVTTPAPTVLAAVVTATTQAPVMAPTITPTITPTDSPTLLSGSIAAALSQTNKVIIGVVVGVGGFLIVTATVTYSRLHGRKARYFYLSHVAAMSLHYFAE